MATAPWTEYRGGIVGSVESYIKKCVGGYYVYHQVERPIEAIRVEGTIALVFGEMNAEISAGGVRKTLRNNALTVWVNDLAPEKRIPYQVSQ